MFFVSVCDIFSPAKCPSTYTNMPGHWIGLPTCEATQVQEDIQEEAV